MRAPSTWDGRPFYPVPMRALRGDVPHLNMSSFPQTTAAGVNHCRPCMEDAAGKQGMYQWDMELSMSYQDLAMHAGGDNPVNTMYPIIFASNDFENWQVVADATDVAGKGVYGADSDNNQEPTHISAPLLVANLKAFGCVGNETGETDPFTAHFTTLGQARAYQWNLAEHISEHGSVTLVACVMRGMDSINDLISHYKRNCSIGGELKCYMPPTEALKHCYALGTACGQACGYVSSSTKHCTDGTLDPILLSGLTTKRVQIKTSVGGGGAAEALVSCSEAPCKEGLHFNDIYVEAENPADFLIDQAVSADASHGGYYVTMFAMTDSKPQKGKKPAFPLDMDIKDHITHVHHHIGDTLHHIDVPIGRPNPTAKPKPKKRVCIDLPGVRLGELNHSTLGTAEAAHTVEACAQACGKNAACVQSVYSAWKDGSCYLFRMATVEVKEFSDHYNSSYCGLEEDRAILMSMLHKAYAQPRKTPVDAPAGPPPPAPVGLWSEHHIDLEDLVEDPKDESEDESTVSSRLLSEVPPSRALSSDLKFSWQIAHVPNLTVGVFKNQGSSSVRVIPRARSCFTQPGFVYMVACMTAKPVYISRRTGNLDPPPFNDRCIAVGGLCGATCGSGMVRGTDEEKARFCPSGPGSTQRRLEKAEFSPYATSQIPHEYLVKPIQPRRSATVRSFKARAFFHMFIFCMMLAYVSTILGKLPGNFTDFYPVHTWDEIRTHGYVMEKFGSAVSCGCSAGEAKMFIFRNWVGKIASRPQFDDAAFPTFRKWVDIFVDEGHREGARCLWCAWTNWLDTNPPVEFLEEWSCNLRELTFEQATVRSPFDLKWDDNKVRKVLPVVADQARYFIGTKTPDEDTNQAMLDKLPAGGVRLQQECLDKLKELFDVYNVLPDSLKLEPALSEKVDCILTRNVSLGLKTKNSIVIPFSKDWKDILNRKVEDRAVQLGYATAKDYTNSVTVTDVNSKKVEIFGSASVGQEHFPLTIKELTTRSDRKVIMVYVARSKPESDRKGIEKTRALDKYLWACLRPSAVQIPVTGSRDNDEHTGLLAGRDDASSSSQSEAGMSGAALVVQNAVRTSIEHQHLAFLRELGDSTLMAGRNADCVPFQTKCAKEYMKYRTVESGWEVARHCYGEIVGEDVDVDGDTVVILDNPSPALLEILKSTPDNGPGSFSGKKGIGLSDSQQVEEDAFCQKRKVSRAAFQTKPCLQFLFTSIAGAGLLDKNKFEQELRSVLGRFAMDSTAEVKRLEINLDHSGADLAVKVYGNGRLIERLRDCPISNLRVLHFQGGIDNHTTITVKKNLLMPYAGVRGKAGGLNYAIDLLQYRDGYIGTGADWDPTPHRMLFGIFDARHQPHPDFWEMCLPKFMRNDDVGYTYNVNPDITMVQAPQIFAGLKTEVDALDVNNGMAFNLMNVIRSRCGGVTSCGTNAVWQINAKEFNRKSDDSALAEFFDSRTKIEDTASTHKHFCLGKRSVYVHEKVVTGIAKLNSDYLGAVQRWAEGAVQLFWIQLFVDKTWQLLLYIFSLMVFFFAIAFSLYGPSVKQILGKNLFCDVDGTATLLLGQAHSFCNPLYGIFSQFLYHTNDRHMFELAAEDYMRMIDESLTWLLVCVGFLITTLILSHTGRMPTIVRINIMTENLTYFWTAPTVFFWFSLMLFMILGDDPPLMFNVTHFMIFVLIIRVCEHGMINAYKSVGECTELSIWRAQQSYTIAAPLYIMSILQGSVAGWGIAWRNLDKSFWGAGDHGEDVVRSVTIWVTFIWVSFLYCVWYTIRMFIDAEMTEASSDTITQQCQLGALVMLGLLCVTVWEPLIAVWGFDKTIEAMSKNKDGNWFLTWWAGMVMWWRSRAWIVRYITDFGLPILILSGLMSGSMRVDLPGLPDAIRKFNISHLGS